MIHKVVIRDNKRSAVKYIANLKNFKNGTEYIFKPGVNVIVGENGCGKTTLMKLIQRYLLVDFDECDRGDFNCNISALFRNILDTDKMLDGVDVYADYDKNTFRLSHPGEKNGEQLKTFNAFGTFFEQQHASTGEGVTIALNSLWERIWGKGSNPKFDYERIGKEYPAYWDYIDKHRQEGDEWTILMDEPDRNLDMEHIKEIKGILSFHKEQTQVIAVVHNPLLIYSLSKNPEVNMIEMTKGYINKVKKTIDDILK